MEFVVPANTEVVLSLGSVQSGCEAEVHLTGSMLEIPNYYGDSSSDGDEEYEHVEMLSDDDDDDNDDWSFDDDDELQIVDPYFSETTETTRTRVVRELDDTELAPQCSARKKRKLEKDARNKPQPEIHSDSDATVELDTLPRLPSHWAEMSPEEKRHTIG
ncbi:hypothetical protein DIPPA_12069 [Diplonema papillatum]|nr:hypothetical protein DIPPA_12069 [Diplonema papillatum]